MDKEKDKDRDYRDTYRDRERDRDYRDRDHRDRDRDRDRDRSSDYARKKTNTYTTDRRFEYAPSSYYTTSTSSTYTKPVERDATGDAEDAMKDDTPRTTTTETAPLSTTITPVVTSAANKDLENVLSNLFKTRDAMLKGIDGVFAELQRRNQLFTQLISREEGRNKEIDGLRAELINIKKDLVTKNEMGCRRIESEMERRLNLLERKLTKTPQYVHTKYPHP